MILKINPIIKPKHYQYYFALSQRTASRFYNADLKYLNKRFITYQDFYNMYEVFPDPKFIPIYIKLSK